MPNWCTNHLYVDGPPEALAAFAAACAGVAPATAANLAAGASVPPPPGELAVVATALLDGTLGTFSLAGAVPDPPANEGATSDADVAAWRAEHWGPAGDVRADTLTITAAPSRLEVVCETPWDPPVAWALAVSLAHPHITICVEAFEPGTELIGGWEIRHGVVVNEYEDLDWAEATW